MERGPLAELLVERFEAMPTQLKVAARFVLDHPEDVALMSMREQANQAGVSHSTMMRLARWIGLNGYEDMRSLYAEAMRNPAAMAANGRLGAEQDGDGSLAITGTVADTLAAQIASLGEYANAMQFSAAADAIAASRRLYSLGMRAEYPVAQHFARTLSLLGSEVIVLDAVGATGIDALRHAGKDDLVVAIGLAPYCRVTVEIAKQATQRGLSVIAITDSSVSPLARLARESVIVSSNSQSFFKSMAPAFAAVEILAALTAVKSGSDAGEAARESEALLASLEVFLEPSR